MSNTYLFLMDLNMIEFYNALPDMKNAYMFEDSSGRLDIYQLNMNKYYPDLYAFSSSYEDFTINLRNKYNNSFPYIFLNINVLNT